LVAGLTGSSAAFGVHRKGASPGASVAETLQRQGEAPAEEEELNPLLHPIAWIKRKAPGLASLLSSGFEPWLKKLGDAVGQAIQPALEALGVKTLREAFSTFLGEFGGVAFDVLSGCCTCLEDALSKLLQMLDGVLESETAKEIQQFLNDAQECCRHRLFVPRWNRLVQRSSKTSLLELAMNEESDAVLPVNDIFARLTAPKVELKRHDGIVLEAQKKSFKANRSPGIGFVHLGRVPMRGVVWRRRWDDSMLIASTDLTDNSEPLWFAYDEVARDRVEPQRGVPMVLPLALRFDAVVGLHLAGLYLMLRAEEKAFDGLLRSLKSSQIASMREALESTLKGLEQAALATQNRRDVRAPNVYPQRKHVIVANLRAVRGAEFFAADAGSQKWLNATFVGANLSDTKKTAASMKAVSKVRAPTRPTQVLQAVIADVAGGFYRNSEPCLRQRPLRGRRRPGLSVRPFPEN
jgi:hypothetical protein